MSKIYEYIQISDYLPKIVLDYFGHFFHFVLFLANIKTFCSNNNHLKPFLGNNENLNTFAIIDIGQMKTRIH